MGVPKIRGTLFRGPDNKVPTIWSTILGSPIFGNPHIYMLPQSFDSGIVKDCKAGQEGGSTCF